MIKLMPVETPNKAVGEDEDTYQQVLIYADEPVTIQTMLIPIGNTDRVGHHIFVYRGVLEENDDETEPILCYDGSLGHAMNGTLIVGEAHDEPCPAKFEGKPCLKDKGHENFSDDEMHVSDGANWTDEESDHATN